jgi:hypothetical protein
MSYAQWSQFTQYQVGDQVVYGGSLYICKVAVGPSNKTPDIDPTNWTNEGSPAGSLPSGLTFLQSITPWTQNSNGFYSGSITGVSPLLTPTSRLSTTLQLATGYTATDVSNSSSLWLITAYPSSANGGTITFFLSDNGVSPSAQTKILLSWAIAGF